MSLYWGGVLFSFKVPERLWRSPLHVAHILLFEDRTHWGSVIELCNLHLSFLEMVPFLRKQIWRAKTEGYEERELGNLKKSVDTKPLILAFINQINQIKIPEWMESLPSMCVVPGFISHCPNYLQHFTLLCIFQYHTTVCFQLMAFSGLLHIQVLLMSLDGEGRHWFCLHIVGVRREGSFTWVSFGEEVISDVVALPHGTFSTSLEPARCEWPPIKS